MSDCIRRVSRPQGAWQIVRCLSLMQPGKRGITLRDVWKGVQRSFRLMVGVGDYPNYQMHMRLHHPEQPVMSEREFHRYCLDARFPSQAGKLGKCPC